MREKDTLAICLKTYPDEDDMEKYCNDEIEPCDVKIYFKGEKYYVNSKYYNKEYYKLVNDKQ